MEEMKCPNCGVALEIEAEPTLVLANASKEAEKVVEVPVAPVATVPTAVPPEAGQQAAQ